MFHSGPDVKKQYNEGALGRIGGFDWFENERLWSRTMPADVVGTLDAAHLVTDGGDDMDMSATVAVTSIGLTFTLAGIFACRAETKQSLGFLQPFVVKTGVAGVLTVSPSTHWTGAKQNICSATSAVLTDSSFGTTNTVTFTGAASTTILQNIGYHKEWATFITADLPLHGGSDKCSRRTQDGISLRVWEDSDIRNDERLMRIDILYGQKVLRPEWATNITD